MLDVIGAIWGKNCGTFWDQNHTCLSANKVEKMLDFIGAFWEKILKMLDHLEHLLGSKSHLNIGLNTIGTYWERKNRLSRGGGLIICGTFGIQITLDYQLKNRTMLVLIGAFWGEKRLTGVSLVEHLWHLLIKITSDSWQKKSKKWWTL